MKVREEARVLIEKAHAFDIRKDEKDYISLLKQAVVADPFFIEPYIMLGFNYFKERDYEQALFNLNRAVELDLFLGGNEDNAEKVYITLGKTYQMFQNKEKSLFSFKTFVGLFPKSQHSEKIIKQIYSKVEDIAHRYAFLKEGYEHFLAGNFEKAVQSFQHSIEGHGVFSWAHYHKGRALMALKLYEEAIESFMEALEHDEHFIFHYSLFETFEALGDAERAGKSFRKALELNPFYALAVLETAERHLRADELDRAEKLVERVLTVEPNREIIEIAKTLQKKISRVKSGEAPDEKPHGGAGERHGKAQKEPAAVREAPGELAAAARMSKDEFAAHAEALFAEIRGRLDSEMERLLEKAGADAAKSWERMISGERHREEELLARMKAEAEELFKARQKEALGEREAMLEKTRQEARKMIEEAEIKAETITSVAQKRRAEEDRDIETRRKRSEERAERIVEDAEAKAEDIIKDARREADKIVERAEKSIEEKRRQIVKEANAEADDIVEEAYRKVEAAEERLLASIEEKVAEALARLSGQSDDESQGSAGEGNSSSNDKAHRGKKGKR